VTQPPEERARIRSYLQGQAAKLSVAELIEKVRADSRQLAQAADAAASVGQLDRPSPDDWSVNEVMEHLHVSCRRINEGMLGAAFDGRQPGAVADRLLPAKESRAASEWMRLIDQEREDTFARMSTLSGDEHLDITWNHPFFGDLNWREWLLFLRLHDLDHAGQVRGIIEALAAR
jgi:hypothetical protein